MVIFHSDVSLPEGNGENGKKNHGEDFSMMWDNLGNAINRPFVSIHLFKGMFFPSTDPIHDGSRDGFLLCLEGD